MGMSKKEGGTITNAWHPFGSELIESSIQIPFQFFPAQCALILMVVPVGAHFMARVRQKSEQSRVAVYSRTLDETGGLPTVRRKDSQHVLDTLLKEFQGWSE